MAIGKCDNDGQHRNPHEYKDAAQHRDDHGSTGLAAHGTAGRMPREEDGQKYSTSYTAPTDQMYSYPGGIRPQGFIGMAGSHDTREILPAVDAEADVQNVHHVGGPTNSNYPKVN